MLRFYLLTFIFLLLIGCNSQRAEMRRLGLPTPTMFQFGQYSRIHPEGNQSNENCKSLVYDPKEESYYCFGLTDGFVSEPLGSIGFYDALIVKLDRKFKVVWVKQFGLTSYGSHATNDSFSTAKLDPQGNLIVLATFNNASRLMSLDSRGETLWDSPVPGQCLDLVIAESIFCAGHDGGTPRNAYIAKFDLKGNFLKSWSLVSGPTVSDTSKNDSCANVALSRSGHIACGGLTESSMLRTVDPATFDGFVWIIDPDESTETVFQIGSRMANEYFQAIKFNSQGHLFALGNFQGRIDDQDLFPGESNATTTNMFLMSFEFNGSSFTQKPILSHTNLTRQTTLEAALMLDNDQLVYCMSTYGQLGGEANPDTAPAYSDIALEKYDTKNGVALNLVQFGVKTKGSFTNKDNQFCSSLTKDQFNNILVGGSTYGSTQEPNAGIQDMMIWRVGPNLEF
jgi:hypothetical protein